MTENQKLREAFETYITDDGKWPNAILKAPGGQYLLLRTSVAWHDWKACAGALALPTAAPVALFDDPRVQAVYELLTDDTAPPPEEHWEGFVARRIVDKLSQTAAPVGERDAFEHDLSKSPFEFDMDRWPDNAPVDWPGSYKQYHVQCAWDAWQARAALSAGDAEDARRYRLVRRGQHFSIINGIGDTLRGEALDAAIDAAMRKGQL